MNWQRYDAYGDTGSASSARVSYPPSSARSLVMLGVSAQMRGVGVPMSDSQPRPHSHHSLESVAKVVATAASATVLNVVGIGTEAGLSV